MKIHLLTTDVKTFVFQKVITLLFSNNNNILLWTRGPYHRHKSTRSGLLYISTHYRNGVCT